MNLLLFMSSEVKTVKRGGGSKSLPGKAVRPQPKPKAASVKIQGGGITI